MSKETDKLYDMIIRVEKRLLGMEYLLENAQKTGIIPAKEPSKPKREWDTKLAHDLVTDICTVAVNLVGYSPKQEEAIREVIEALMEDLHKPYGGDLSNSITINFDTFWKARELLGNE